MGTLADSLFNTMLLWVRALVSGIWALFTSDKTTLLEFLGKHWLVLALGICAVGMAIDLLVWMLRWQPFHKEERKPKASDDRRARAAQAPGTAEPSEPAPEIFIDETPEPKPSASAERAEALPDEHAYPGMRYRETGTPVRQDTQHFRPVQSESEAAGDAHAEYRRQLEAYERQKAQYELDMAEYRRKKAAYDAETAREAAEQLKPAENLPPPPDWSEVRGREPKLREKAQGNEGQKKLTERLAGWIDPEEDEIRKVPAIRTGRRRGDRHE